MLGAWWLFGGPLTSLRFRIHLDPHGLAGAFAAARQPITQRLRQARGSDAESSFDAAFADRESVIKFRRTGEVAHTKTIEPFERARPTVFADDDMDGKFLREHKGKV